MIFVPFGIVLVSTFIELILIATTILTNLESKYDGNFKLYTIIAFFIPTVPIIGQGTTYVILARKIRVYLKSMKKITMFYNIQRNAEDIEEFTKDKDTLDEKISNESDHYQKQTVYTSIQ